MLIKIENRKSIISEIILFLFFSIYFISNGQHNKKVLFLFFLYLVALNAKRLVPIARSLINSWPLIIIIIWCFITSFWSIWPSESRYTTITQVLLLFTCHLIIFTYKYEKIINCIQWSLALFIFINCLYFVIFPGSSFSAIGATGIAPHKNAFGLITAIALISFIFFNDSNFLKNKTLRTALILFASLFLLISFSKTSILLFLVCVSISLTLKRIPTACLNYHCHFIKLFSIPIIVTVFTVIHCYQDIILDFLYYNYSDEFLTGRGRIWMALILNNSDSITQGLGFGSVWDKGEYSEIFFTDIYETDPLWAEGLAAADGGYTDLLLSIGLIGTAMFFIYIFNTLRYILISIKDKNFLFISAIFFFTIFHNITETTFLLGSVNAWFLFVLISCMANLHKNKKLI